MGCLVWDGVESWSGRLTMFHKFTLLNDFNCMSVPNATKQPNQWIIPLDSCACGDLQPTRFSLAIANRANWRPCMHPTLLDIWHIWETSPEKADWRTVGNNTCTVTVLMLLLNVDISVSHCVETMHFYQIWSHVVAMATCVLWCNMTVNTVNRVMDCDKLLKLWWCCRNELNLKPLNKFDVWTFHIN